MKLKSYMTVIVSLLLSIFGLFNILGIKPTIVFNQFIYILVGFLAFFIVKKIGKNFFSLNAKFFYWLFFILLVITYLVGFEVKGSKRWLNLYFFNFQTSEILKIFFIIFLADLFTQIKIGVNKLVYFLRSGFYFFLPTLIIFKKGELKWKAAGVRQASEIKSVLLEHINTE